MNPRVYDHQEVQAHLRLLGRDGGVVLRAPMTKVSPAGGILKCNAALKREQIMHVELEIGSADPIHLKAQVLRTGRTGVFVAWYPPDDVLHRSISDALATEAIRRGQSQLSNTLAFEERGSRRPTDALNIRDRARAVSALDLAARHKTVHVLDLSTIQQTMDQAVADAIKGLEGVFGEEQRGRLLEETERNFEQRIETLRAEKIGLEEKVSTVTTQFEQTKQLLDEERERVIAAQRFTVSEAGMVQLEQRFERIIDRAGREGRVPESLESELREVVLRLLDDERERIAEQARQAQGSTIDLLERKVDRLAQTLEETRVERNRAQQRAHALESAAGESFQANVMTAGLDEEDPFRKQKLALLQELVDDNKELRDYANARTAS